MKFRLTACLASTFVVNAAAAQTDFSSHWHDGRAELDGYRWSVTRYGEPRSGQAVMIFVTEPFSASRLVKVDDPARKPSDVVDVLKLNLVRDFQTGIYDYNTMTSVFARSDDFSPLKVSFTSAEWCGHVYEELRFDRSRITERFFSYFEGETSEKKLDRESGGVAEDNLFIVLRGLRGAFLEPGGKTTVPLLPSAFHRRLTHRPIKWSSAQIERLREPQDIEVPAGRFEQAHVYVVTTDDGREGRFFIEREHPYRVLKWGWTARQAEAAESGELTGTVRVKYWRLHDEGDERLLEELGLVATQE